MKNILFLACMAFGLNACVISEPAGGQGNTIRFSTTNLLFDAKGGTQSITSEGDDWYMDGTIKIDGKGYDLIDDGDYVFVTERIGNDNTNVGIKKVECPWFTIDRETSQKITFSVTENTTAESRNLRLYVSDGNYFTSITVTQSAE